jgi:glycosyltransferase involved in cell wall biosynthesis
MMTRPVPAATVIITTYNRPDALEVSLESFRHQQQRDFEIIVADDGSGPETAALIERISANFPVPVRHVWHPDEGFRLSAIRNRAIAQARGDYIIMIDGDCLVLNNFVRQHLLLREPGMFVSGWRSWLWQRLTRRVLAAGKPASGMWPYWFMWGLFGQVTAPFGLISLPPGLRFRYRLSRQHQRAPTCNYALWKKDFLAVGGFDERYVAHGYEDWDLSVRLIRSGVLRKDGAYGSIVLHLFHARTAVRDKPENVALFKELQASDRVMAGHLNA